MVSSLSILFIIITLFISILAPLVFLLILMRGHRGVFSIWLAGALGFFVPQMIIRIPLLQMAGTLPAFALFSQTRPYQFALLLALTAAAFETAGRLLVLKVGLGKRLSFNTGLAAGAGHGGIEAIALIGLTYVNNLVISLMINAGRLDTIIPDPALADSIRRQLTDTPSWLFLTAGVERLLTMVFHIAMSVLLTLFIMKRKSLVGFILVMGLHFILDFVVVAMQIQSMPIWLIEGVVLIAALLSLVMVLLLRKRFGSSQAIPADPGEQAVLDGY